MPKEDDIEFGIDEETPAISEKNSEKNQEPSQAQYEKIRMPKRDLMEMFAVVEQISGGNHFKAFCEDGESRTVRIPGKLRNRTWVREGDLIIVKLWEFGKDRADLIWKYKKSNIDRLKMQGFLKSLQNWI
jgi:translation initiation factor 1A